MPRSVSSTYKTHTDTAIQLRDSATRDRRGVPLLLAMSAVTAVTCCMTRRQLLWSQQGTFPRQRKRECGEHITHAAWTCHAAHMLCKPPHGLHALRTERSAPHFVHFVPRENRKPAVKRYILVKHHHGCVVCIDPKHGQNTRLSALVHGESRCCQRVPDQESGLLFILRECDCGCLHLGS